MASIAESNSLFEIDTELDGLLEKIEEQAESEGQTSILEERINVRRRASEVTSSLSAQRRRNARLSYAQFAGTER